MSILDKLIVMAKHMELEELLQSMKHTYLKDFLYKIYSYREGKLISTGARLKKDAFWMGIYMGKEKEFIVIFQRKMDYLFMVNFNENQLKLIPF